MNAELLNNLIHLENLLRKYHHYAQANVMSDIIASIERGEPHYKRLAGVDMWGGAGAVWEVELIPGGVKSKEHKEDERAFRRSIINIAAQMDQLGIGHARSRSTADIFGKWIEMFD
jgi:hypothetical protein